MISLNIQRNKLYKRFIIILKYLLRFLKVAIIYINAYILSIIFDSYKINLVYEFDFINIFNLIPLLFIKTFRSRFFFSQNETRRNFPNV